MQGYNICSLVANGKAVHERNSNSKVGNKEIEDEEEKKERKKKKKKKREKKFKQKSGTYVASVPEPSEVPIEPRLRDREEHTSNACHM